MTKCNPKILRKIIDLYKSDSYTIAEVCVNVGISERSYYNYQSQDAVFAETIEKAKQEFNDQMLVECRKSLVKLIKGYDYEEIKTITIAEKGNKPSIKEESITKKHMSPNLGAIIHFQTNRDPGEWKNRQSTEVTGKDGKDLIPARVLTKEEAKEYLSKIENEC